MINEATFDNETQRILLSKVIVLSSENTELLDQLENLFRALQYKNISRFDKSITVINGNEDKNGWHNNPLKWYNKIHFNIKDQEIKIDFEWSVMNQVLTRNERDFMDHFISELIEDLMIGKLTNEKYINMASKAKNTGIKMTIGVILGVAIFSIPSLYLGFYLDNVFLFFVGIILGTYISFKLVFKWMNIG